MEYKKGTQRELFGVILRYFAETLCFFEWNAFRARIMAIGARERSTIRKSAEKAFLPNANSKFRKHCVFSSGVLSARCLAMFCDRFLTQNWPLNARICSRNTKKVQEEEEEGGEGVYIQTPDQPPLRGH